eukprot:GFKZ01001536.1.p1 GENE.GFKZ01001536.1~~GFKZ01001536.1.p1  ORF type:complete len:1055 (+),score=191.42 GFKZ01001536.1:322-3486(+)
MDKDKNLEELMAAIGENKAPNPPRNFGTSSALPIPSVGIPPTTVQTRTPSTNPEPVGNVTGRNLSELVTLLDDNKKNTRKPVQVQPVMPSQVPAGGTLRPVMDMMSRQATIGQRQIPGRHAPGLDRKTAAQFQRQQQLAAAATAMKSREASLSTGPSNYIAASSLNPSTTTGSRAGDITDELKAVMQTASSADGGPAAAARPGNAAQRRPVHRQRQAQAASAPGGQRQMPQDPRAIQSAPTERQSRHITHEQIILGHFCRHAIKTLGRVMEGNPARRQAEVQLREHIKTAWAKWVRGLITRQRLLDSVATFVKSSCPEAAHVDVVGEFKVWYEREFELQRQRNAVENGKALRQQQGHQQLPKGVHTQQGQASPPKLEPKLAGSRAVASAMENMAQTRIPVTVSASAGRGTATVGQPVKFENQLTETQARLAKGVSQPSQGRTAGKSISNKALNQRKTQAKNPRAGSSKAVAGKTVGNKTVGSKTLPRHLAAPGIVAVGVPAQPTSALKGPSTAAVVQLDDVRTGAVGGKHVAGNKGLAPNKTPSAAKQKHRKQTPKTAQKTATKKPKVSPKNSGNPSAAKQKGPPPVSAPGTSTGMNTENISSPISGKRPPDVSGKSPTGPAVKKPKGNAKGPRGGVGKKKGAVPVPVAAMSKDDRPPPARADMGKGRPPVGPSGGATASGQVADAKGGQPPSGAGNAGPVQMKKAKGVDDELSVVHNVVDIENEEDMLGRDAGAVPTEVVEEVDYDSDLLLAGPALRSKMQDIASKFGIDQPIGKEVMEMMSLAVRERLATIIEGLRDIADVRTEVNKQEWNTEPSGPDLSTKLDWMRMDEERSLVKAAELRIKRKKEEEEQEAKRIAGESEKEEKKAKDSTATGDQERKEKLALEKKRKEHNSQTDALSGLLEGINKRRKKPGAAKGLAPLVPLGKIGSSSKEGGLSRLPPIQRVAGSTLPEISKQKGGDKRGGSKTDPLENMPPQGELVALGGASRLSGARGSGGKKSVGKGDENVVKRVLTLKDCIFYMESSQNMQKSTLLYKWYGRMGTNELRNAAAEQ